ncbi:gamma-glutamyltransferase [Gracilibacillus oryzae]|nr:gamma-glutamyltransferase [Gracilibacillus oryzae]
MIRPSIIARNAAVTSPNYLASQTGLKILQNGGNAIHAAIAMAATLSVVYPHMNGIGGDNFWLVYNSNDQKLKGINASGRSGEKASIMYYRQLGYDSIPMRGHLAANTVPGALSGWVEAYHYADTHTNQKIEWANLLEDAIDYAANGFPVTKSQIKMAESFLVNKMIDDRNDFDAIFIQPIRNGLKVGDLFYQKDLARTLRRVAEDKGRSFYSGTIAEQIERSCRIKGVLTKQDFHYHTADWIDPICTQYRDYVACNLPPNTQGIASLSILNILNQYDLSTISEHDPEYYHLIIEATKLAFELRDKWVTDPGQIEVPLDQLLSDSYGKKMADQIDDSISRKYQPLLDPKGDTVWLGVVDQWGNAVSMIQSIYHEYGSAVVPEGTGVLLQNRGSFFSLQEDELNRLEPRKRPFHTLNPAMLFKQNRPYLIYGTMGGEGQPQTQAAIVTKLVDYGYYVQQALDAPRWLYGRTWGAVSNSLKVEKRISPAVLEALVNKGHKVEVVSDYSDLMGHAGAIKINDANIKFAGSDPRSDGLALGY